MGWPAHWRAAAAILVLGGYLQLVEWVDLYPWNDVRGGNGQEGLDLALGAITLALAAWLCVSRRAAPVVAALGLLVWAALQVTSWWSPYVWGASEGWKRTYDHWFAGTVQVLPNDGVHLPPDANHLVLQVLIVGALAVCAAAAWDGFRRPAPSSA